MAVVGVVTLMVEVVVVAVVDVVVVVMGQEPRTNLRKVQILMITTRLGQANLSSKSRRLKTWR